MLQSSPAPVPSFLCVYVSRLKDGCKFSEIPSLRSGLCLPSSWTWAGWWLLWLTECYWMVPYCSGPSLEVVGKFLLLAPWNSWSSSPEPLCKKSDDPAGETCGEASRWHGEGEGSHWDRLPPVPTEAPGMSLKLFGAFRAAQKSAEYHWLTPVDTTWSIIAQLLEFLTLKIVSYNNHGGGFKPRNFEINQSSLLPEILHESQIWGGVIST